MAKEINFLDGETSEIFNKNKHKRYSEYHEDVSCELLYIPINNLSFIFDHSDLPKNIYERQTQDSLVTSVMLYGILSPIIVVPNNPDDRTLGYTVVDGEKRVNAAIQNGKGKILAIVNYNIGIQSAKVARILLKERVFESPLAILQYQKDLRDITNDFDEETVEQLLNYKTGDFEKIRSLQRRINLHMNDNIGNDEKTIFVQVLTGDVLPEDALNQFDKIEKKEKCKAEKQDKKIKEMEKEQGLDSIDEKEEQASATLTDNNNNNVQDPTLQEQQDDDKDLFAIGEQNYQQYVGDERRILPTSLTKQIYARDESQCVVCGYGGPNNLSVSTLLEKHHIVDVQYGGTDNINNLVLLCPNCHRLVTNFLNGKPNEYAPNNNDLQKNPQDYGAVVLGNMGRIAKREALRRIKKADLDVYAKVLDHKETVGQGIKELQLTHIMPKEFNDNAYGAMKKAFFALQKKHIGFKIKNNQLMKEYVANENNLATDNIQQMTDINGVNINAEHEDKVPNHDELVAPEDKQLPDAHQDIDTNKEQLPTSNNQKSNIDDNNSSSINPDISSSSVPNQEIVNKE